MLTQGFVYSGGRPVAVLTSEASILMEHPLNSDQTPDLDVIEIDAILADGIAKHLVGHFLELHVYLVHAHFLQVVTYTDCELTSSLKDTSGKIRFKVNLDSRVKHSFSYYTT